MTKNVWLCIVIGAIVGSVVASTTKEWWLTGVGAGVGVGLGKLFDRAGMISNRGVGLLNAGVLIGAGVGSIAASTAREWWLTGMGIGAGMGVAWVIAMYLSRASSKDQ